MDQGAFARSGAVQDFIGWMRELPPAEWEPDAPAGGVPAPSCADELEALRALPRIMVRVNIPHSRFVPGGLRVHGPLGALPLHYRWQAPGVVPGDFATTRQHLAALSQQLRQAVNADDLSGTLAACTAILRWGGERNMAHGARPYLLQWEEGLPQFLRSSSELLQLDTVTLDRNLRLRGVPAMNSMLSKIYSLLATDGLPIYDSRVAGAMATIVETWRQCTGRQGRPVPRELAFYAIPPNRARTVTARFSTAQTPGVLVYGEIRTPSYWAAAMVRLGWLLQLMLGPGASPGAMRAMEVALFMAGYDCAGIARPMPPAVCMPVRPQFPSGATTALERCA